MGTSSNLVLTTNLKNKVMSYTNITTTDNYPKTLMIRNHEGGLIWQVYHVKEKWEADKLASNAHGNGFFGSTLEEYQPRYKETWPDWRETCGWF